MTDYDDRPREASGHGGIYAILVVIVILLVGGFLYFSQVRDDGPDIEIEVPQLEGTDIDTEAPDVEISARGRDGEAGGDGGGEDG